MSEPSLETLGGMGAGRIARRFLLATRPAFFTASVLPVLLGTAWGYRQSGVLDLSAFLVALAAVICAHAATNVLNDVYDDASGADIGNDDRLHPFTGGSRFIQNGILTRGEMARWGTLLAGISVALGLVLVALKGFPIIVLGAVGLALGVLYSAPPMQLSARGTGEIAVGVGLGMLPVCGAAWLQSGTVTPATVLLSLPVAAWVMNILVINEVPDARADARAGKRTLVVRMGLNGTRFLYLGLHGSAALIVLLMVLAGHLTIPALFLPLAVALGSPFAARGITSDMNREQLATGIKLTLAAHAAGILWLLGWVLAG
jgi:1,4-dihydroxy-2-naphthoate octaprenyltransferase